MAAYKLETRLVRRVNGIRHAHFIGIGGYGMSAIARVLLDMGIRVTGSDVAENKLIKRLLERGAVVHIGHDASHVEGADLVVYSSSIPEENVERVEAQRRGIPVLHRSQMLARLLNNRFGIAVAGAHGKTTTSSMIAQTLELCGKDPSYVIGGEILGLDGNAKAGNSPYVVAEADESDGTFLEYYPKVAVVTNIEKDHLENYDGDFRNLKKAYRRFLSQVKSEGLTILCLDDPHLREIARELDQRLITYGIDQSADYNAVDIRRCGRQVSFRVVRRGEELGEVTLQVPGHHNVSNALAALIVCLEIGLSFPEAAEALGRFQGAKRRFQLIGEVDGITVVDDYAHHPTEIQATLSGAKAMGKRIVAVFQPQRYSRTYFLMEEFSRAFGQADEVIITDIYSPPGEKPIPGVTSERLAQLIRQNSNPNTLYCPAKEDVVSTLLGRIQPNDLIMTMGAGDIWRVAQDLVAKLGERTRVGNQ